MPPGLPLAVLRLKKFYENGVTEIKLILNSIDPTSIDRAGIEKKIAQITQDLEIGTRKWIEEEYPNAYVEAAVLAREQLNEEFKKINKRLLPKAYFPAPIEQETISVLSNTVFNIFSEALGGVRRRTSTLLNTITQEKIRYDIAERAQGLRTLKELKGSVSDILNNSGVQTILDKGGRAWQLDSYAEMVARTEHTAVINSAVRNQSLLAGIDLVRVTIHGATDSCGLFEGKIYSLTGTTQGYPHLDKVIAGTHLFGPNCRHSYVPISERSAGLLPNERGSDVPYVDLRKFAKIPASKVGGVVQQQRDLIRLFPNLSREQQKSILGLARQSKSPSLAALEELFAQGN